MTQEVRTCNTPPQISPPPSLKQAPPPTLVPRMRDMATCPHLHAHHHPNSFHRTPRRCQQHRPRLRHHRSPPRGQHLTPPLHSPTPESQLAAPPLLIKEPHLLLNITTASTIPPPHLSHKEKRKPQLQLATRISSKDLCQKKSKPTHPCQDPMSSDPLWVEEFCFYFIIIGAFYCVFAGAIHLVIH